MSWIDDYKGLEPWDFTKSAADDHYNEGDRIATSEDPVWSIEHSAIPITELHTPCGYWNNKTRDYTTYFTSKLYPIIDIEDLESYSGLIIDGSLRALLHRYEIPVEELESSSASIISGELRALLKYYDDGEVEELESSSATILFGELRSLLKTYEDGAVEELESSSATILSGSLDDVLIHYENGDVEELESYSATIVGGTLE